MTDLNPFFVHSSEHAKLLFDHFIKQFETIGEISIYPTKTMVGIDNGHKRVAWVTKSGKNFVHIVFPFKQPYNDNLCFQKIAQVPGDETQFNHHLRILQPEDINEEVLFFMKKAYQS